MIGLIILSVSLFYFLPIPQAVKDVAKNQKLERCIYSGGIGYYTPVVTPDDFHYFFNSQGKALCYTGGIAGIKAEGICKAIKCFPVNN